LVALLNDGVSFVELSVNDIAQRAGITRSAFYFYFPSKEAALLAASTQVTDRLLEAWQPFVQGMHDDPRRSLEASFANVTRVRHAHGPLIRALSDAASTDRATWKATSAIVERFAGLLANRVMQIREDRGQPLSRQDAGHLALTLAWCNERNFYRAMVDRYDQNEWHLLVKALMSLWMGVLEGDTPAKIQPPRRPRSKRR
jgi:AcrR family transcriptional regulator